MPVLYQKYITRADLRANPKVLYAFGDNEERVGRGGQAREMRGEPNAVGIATKAAPYVYWKNLDAERQNAVIDADMAPLFQAVSAGEIVVLPLDGVGSGLADLANQAPKTWAHLNARITLLSAQDAR